MSDNSKPNAKKTPKATNEELTPQELDTCEPPVEKSEELTPKELQEVVAGLTRPIGGSKVKYLP